ncbi:MAG: hypothetical protein M3162_00255 [Thermoproteota archaeon]|nr:hypothetical protein [Thermoproteota archaeon]
MLGIALDDLSIARGMAISNIDEANYFNLVLGIGMHIVTGAIAGIIFVLITSKINRFRINSFRDGIAKGVVYSIIVFLLLFVPTTVGMVQPNLVDIINQSKPGQNNSQDQKEVEKNYLPLYGFGFIAHIVFGVVLGLLIFLLVHRKGTNAMLEK